MRVPNLKEATVAQLDLNPPAENAHDGELSPLGTIGQQMQATGSDPNNDAALLAQQVLSGDDLTRTGIPLSSMNHGGQPVGGGGKSDYASYSKAGREKKLVQRFGRLSSAG